MSFVGMQIECDEVIAELDALLGYPRGYTQADVDSGLVSRVGGGIHVPLELLRTETVAEAQPVESDEHGAPVGDDRVVRLPADVRAERRDLIAKHRVLRVLNRATREQLIALPGIGGVRADAIIARRAQGRYRTAEHAREVLTPAILRGLLDAMGDDDVVAALVAARKAAR